jgi:hypothetical protein
MNKLKQRVNQLLLGLFLYDTMLTSWVFLAPGLWFWAFHGIPYHDPEGFLRRCGANWAAFALFQGIARFRWQHDLSWIAVAAGIRLSDIFTDWAYLFYATDMTWFGGVGLALSSPLNLLFGLWLLRAHRMLCDEERL